MNTRNDITTLRLDQLSLEFARLRLARPELIKSMEQSLAKFGQLSPLIVRQGWINLSSVSMHFVLSGR